VQVRLTLVPGFNDDDDDLAAIADWLAQVPGAPAVVVQPFHRMAAAKETLYGRRYAWAEAAPSRPGRLVEARRRLG
jgi:pyruvate-formate lyase-activating enzyme